MNRLLRHSSLILLGPAIAILIFFGFGERAASFAEEVHSDRDLSSRPASYGEPRLAVIDRWIAQDQGRWLAAYRLRLEADDEFVTVIQPRDITVRIDGWVSNARVPGLERPVPSQLTLRGDGGRSAVCDLIVPNRDWDSERRERMLTRERCRMALIREPDSSAARGESPALAAPPSARQVVLTKFRESAPSLLVAPAAAPGSRTPNAAPTPSPTPSVGRVPSFDQPLEPFRFATGDTVLLLLELEHQRFLYGPHDPLLGKRQLELKLGELTFRDVMPMCRDRRAPSPRCPLDLEPIPDDRLDPAQYVTAPHSLHLESHVAGNQSYRFKEQEVRYSTPMRLSFWYLVAHGTQGRCKAKVSQYCEGPAQHWREVDGGFEVNLDVVGEWVHVEKVFRTHAQANRLDLHFRIVNGDIGEAWLDDIILEPLDSTLHAP